MTTSLQPLFPEERRWATVLFADVAGFTQLSERMEFESISSLLKEVWLRLDDVIWKYGGFIDKHLGDGVMAVWGAPYTGESDAERSVSAGLALVNAMRKFTTESEKPGVQNLVLRVGINTGPVLAGYVGAKEEYTVLGDTVNIAKRLEQMADSGRVLIGENTYRLVRGDFKIRLLGPITFRGKTEPIRAYIVDEKREFSTKVRYQSEEMLHTSMVAREYEIQKLTALFHQAINFRKPSIVLVSGGVGIGKSRLLLEFTNMLEESEPHLTLITTRALQQTSKDPFFMWKSLWQNRFGILDDDSSDVFLEKFENGMRSLWGVEADTDEAMEATYLIGSFVGVNWPGNPYLTEYLNKPDLKVAKVFELTKKLFAHIGSIGPVVLLFDDLQWADNLSLELIKYLVKPGPDRIPLLILGGVHNEFLAENINWRNIGEIISLKALPNNAEIARLAYPDLANISMDVLAEIAKISDGSPLYMEEIVKGLIKSGVIYSDKTSQDLITILRHNTPNSLQAMLQARLDSLPRGARTIALMASVVGRVFWVGPVLAAARSASYTGTGLLKLRPPMIERVVQDGLRKLVQSELTFPRAGTHFSEDQEYIFKHSLFRDVTYNLIPQKYLPQYHLAVARWLVIRQDTKYKIMAADHFDKAGALREAARYYEYAFREAETRGANEEARWFLSKTQDIKTKLDDQT